MVLSLRHAADFAVLPVFNEAHAVQFQAISQTFPLMRICGVVTDPTGYQTHLAFRSGAVVVLNTLMPASVCEAALQLLTKDFADTRGSPLTRPETTDAGFDIRVPEQDNEHQQLLRLLQEGLTTAQIALRLHCSERSAYRRLRQLYINFGVENRRELCEALERINS